MNIQTFFIICRAFFPNCEFDSGARHVQIIFKNLEIISLTYVRTGRYDSNNIIIYNVCVSKKELIADLKRIKKKKEANKME